MMIFQTLLMGKGDRKRLLIKFGNEKTTVTLKNSGSSKVLKAEI